MTDKFHWTGSGTDFGTPDDWTDATRPDQTGTLAPGPDDLAFFYIGGLVTGSGNVAGITVEASVTFDGAFAMNAFANSGVLKVAAGTFNTSYGFTNAGTLILSGGSIDSNYGGPNTGSISITGGGFTLGQLNNTGSVAVSGGTLTVTSFATNDGSISVTGGGFTLGQLDNTGSVAVSGGTLTVTSFATDDGSMTISDTGKLSMLGAIDIGATRAGTLAVTNGGSITIDSYVVLGASTVGSSATLDSAAWTQSGDLAIGEGGARATMTIENGASLQVGGGIYVAAGGASGTATGGLTIESGSTVSVLGGFGLRVGQIPGDVGTLIVTGNGTDLRMARAAGSTIDLGIGGGAGDGHITIEAGAHAEADYLVIGGDVEPYPAGTTGEGLIASGAVVTTQFGGVGEFGSTATLTIDNATWNARGYVDIGEEGAAHGHLIVTDGGVLADATGDIGTFGATAGTAAPLGAVTIATGGTWTNSGSLIVGDRGVGTLLVYGGGATYAGDLYLGQNTGGVGAVTLDASATLDVGGTLDVGVHGTGSLAIESNVTAGADVDLGVDTGGIGDITVGDGITLAATGTLVVGDYGTGSIALSGIVSSGDATIFGNNTGGKGSVTVGDGAILSVTSDLMVGNYGIGTLDVTTGGLVTAMGDLIVAAAAGGSGTLDLNGGSLGLGGTLDGGAGDSTIKIQDILFDLPDGMNLAEETGSVSTADLVGAGTDVTANADVDIGGDGTATMTVSDGAELDVATGNLDVGNGNPAAAGSAELSIKAASMVRVDSDIGMLADGYNEYARIDVDGGMLAMPNATVGSGAGGNGGIDVSSMGRIETTGGMVADGVNGGTGLIRIESDGGWVSDRVRAGDDPGTGTIDVDGAGAYWTDQEGATIGDAGTGVLDISDGGSVDIMGTLDLGVTADATGNVTVDDATLDVGGDLFVGEDGTATLAIVDGGALTVDGNLEVGIGQGSGTVDASDPDIKGDLIVKNGVFKVVAGAPLTVGGAIVIGPAALATANGTLDIGENAFATAGTGDVLIGDQGTGRLTIEAGGTLAASSNTVTIASGVTSIGTVALTGAGAHLRAGVLVVGDGGEGTLTLASGATVDAQGDITIAKTGLGSDTEGAPCELVIDSDARIAATSGTVTLAQSNGTAAYVSDVGSLDSAALVVGAAGVAYLVVGGEGYLLTEDSAEIGGPNGGSGTVAVNGTWNVDDTLSVGDGGYGSLSVQGTVRSNPGGLLQIGAGSSGGASRVTVGGADGMMLFTSGAVGGTTTSAGQASTLAATGGAVVTFEGQFTTWAGSTTSLDAGSEITVGATSDGAAGAFTVAPALVAGGAGTIDGNIVDNGTIVATGGSLELSTQGGFSQAGLTGTGTLAVKPDGTLVIQGLGGPMVSTIATLDDAGALSLPPNQPLNVTGAYTNANWGSGNSFNPHAGFGPDEYIYGVGSAFTFVPGTGPIVSSAAEGRGPALTPITATLSLTPTGGGLYAGTFRFSAGGTPDLTIAVQTTGLTSPAITGITPGNVTLSPGQSSLSYNVTYDPAAGPLQGSIELTPDFDNLAPVQITFAEAPCFHAGTSILTARGEVAVESLRIGDRLPTQLGRADAPIIWLGHRRVDGSGHHDPFSVWPVRVRAGAIAPNQPRRDLLLSPEHAAYVGGVLIPIRHLINGATIVSEPAGDIVYWHIELDRHDVILAEGMPAETFLDTGNRAAFDNDFLAPAPADTAATAASAWAARGCAPLVEGGPLLEKLRARLAARASGLGYSAMAPHVLELDTTGAIESMIPGGVGEIRLVSESVVLPGDRRSLGAALTEITLDAEIIGLRDSRLVHGFHVIEGEPGRAWRWTDGAGVLLIKPTETPRRLTLKIVSIATQTVRQAA